MFLSSHRFDPFDYLRVPYAVDVDLALKLGTSGLGALRVADPGGVPERLLLWPRSAGHRRPSGMRFAVFRTCGFTVAGQVRETRPDVLADYGSSWAAFEPVRTRAGDTIAWIWRDAAGSLYLPFDPGEVMTCLWSEAYTRSGTRARLEQWVRKGAIRCYYTVRPLVPRKTQLRLRRRFTRTLEPAGGFPSWPVEHGLHDMYDWLLTTVTRLAGRPVAWLAPWPDGKDWAMVLSHDVETAVGVRSMELLRGEERARGYRSAWNFVPERYDVSEGLLEAVRKDGCEIGVHGLRHDGRDLASVRRLRQRLPGIRQRADAWSAVGFRSPATQRGWRLMPLLGFDYDSSYTDTEPYEPQPGGCCTYLPFFIDDLVELPITLPQDHTLFEILHQRDGAVWMEKTRQLRSRGGLVLALTHPDYASNPRAVAAWRSLLAEFEGDRTMWQPLPREVASWWRERAASVPVLTGGSWTVSGPAAGRARVRVTQDLEPEVAGA